MHLREAAAVFISADLYNNETLRLISFQLLLEGI